MDKSLMYAASAPARLIDDLTLTDVIEKTKPQSTLILCDMSASTYGNGHLYDEQRAEIQKTLPNGAVDIAMYRQFGQSNSSPTEIRFVDEKFSFASPPADMAPEGGTDFVAILRNDLLEDYDLVIHITDGMVKQDDDLKGAYQDLWEKGIILVHACVDAMGTESLKEQQIGLVFETVNARKN